ncbi:hypothetical protein [Qipengyuania qiaonensis]|uniref:Uncharacterized protein n=1 Tax=Qipengyuania qiaonensis TaxID=2867240 RepID=A0ABS7J9F6_9SPHN|nr:hypothetical protein [Qipengyuania qiaonensis]MBX7483932.1 hypothetical protein [Qipengyuania qiaonensis]
MSLLSDAGARSQRKLRLAVIAAALGVAACFVAAFTFADGNGRASQITRNG